MDIDARGGGERAPSLTTGLTWFGWQCVWVKENQIPHNMNGELSEASPKRHTHTTEFNRRDTPTRELGLRRFCTNECDDGDRVNLEVSQLIT